MLNLLVHHVTLGFKRLMQGRHTKFTHEQNKLLYIDDKSNVNKSRPINSLYTNNKVESTMILFIL